MTSVPMAAAQRIQLSLEELSALEPRRQRHRGGKAGKRTALRELHGYVPKAKAKAKAKPEAAPLSRRQRKRARKAEAERLAEQHEAEPENEEQAEPEWTLVAKKHRKSTGSQGADRPWTIFAPSSSSKPKVPTPPSAPPTAEQRRRAAEQELRPAPKLTPQPKWQPRPSQRQVVVREDPLQRPDNKELLEKAKDAPQQHQRIEARRELRKRLLEEAPRGSAGRALVSRAPSICSTCVDRRIKSAPHVRAYANKWIARQRALNQQRRSERLETVERQTEAPAAPSRSPSSSPVILRSVSEVRERSGARSRSYTPDFGRSVTPSPRDATHEDSELPAPGTVIRGKSPTPTSEPDVKDRPRRRQRSRAPSPSLTRKRRVRTGHEEGELATTLRARSRDKKKKKRSKRTPSVSDRSVAPAAEERIDTTASDAHKDESPVEAILPTVTTSHRTGPIVAPATKPEAKARPKLQKENLRKRKQESYKAALMNPPPKEVLPKAAPKTQAVTKFVTLDFHGVVDSGPEDSFPEEAFDAMYTLYNKRKICFWVISFIGKNSHRLRQQCKDNVNAIRNEFVRRYGVSPITGMSITDDRVGPKGKVPEIKRLNAVAHVDDNVHIVNDVCQNSDAQGVLLVRRRAPNQLDRKAITGNSLIGCLRMIFGNFDREQ